MDAGMTRGRRLAVAIGLLTLAVATGARAGEVRYRIEPGAGRGGDLRARFDASQLALLEKLNRRDARNLSRASELVVPDRWDLDEVAYAPLPAMWPWAESQPTALVVHQPGQVFGGYEHGRLVRWGPVSSGAARRPTPSGLFHLNWRSPGRHSTVNREWYMPWYFNFDSRRGLSLHQYVLPGRPASHACIRLLERDARWLYGWGQGWAHDASGRVIPRSGTPVVVVGSYDFAAPPPWTSPAWVERGIAADELRP
jgi:hypothetical protein